MLIRETIMKKIITALIAFAFLGLVGYGGVSARAASGDKITIDGTYLKKAVVSDIPIELEAEVRDSVKRIKFGEKLVWTVTEGEDVAEITDGKIIFKKPGNFTVKAEEENDSFVSSTFSGKAYEAVFSNVTFNNSFDGVTVDTQPIKLSGIIEVRGIAPADDCHYELTYEVVSGPAEIYLSEFLRITGKGTVVLKASSRYDGEVSTTVTFDVTDPDEGKTVGPDVKFEQEHTTGKTSGCGATVGVTPLLMAAAVFCCAAVKSKNKRK